MKKLHLFLALALSTSCCFGQERHDKFTSEQLNLAKFFEGFRGSFALYDLSDNVYMQYNPDTCATRFTPCSTFKIVNSLIALETGVAADTSFAIQYDSVEHPLDPALLSSEPFKHWPHDQTMTTAFRYSVVWYYQEIAKKIGPERMQQYLDSLQYGNEDISSGIDRFWLGGSLQISSSEQVVLMTELVENRLHGFSVTTQEKVKGLMLLESTPLYRLYGKTGGGRVGPESTIGWFVGFVEAGPKTYTFALNVFAKSFDELHGKRVELTKWILHSMKII